MSNIRMERADNGDLDITTTGLTEEEANRILSAYFNRQG